MLQGTREQLLLMRYAVPLKGQCVCVCVCQLLVVVLIIWALGMHFVVLCGVNYVYIGL